MEVMKECRMGGFILLDFVKGADGNISIGPTGHGLTQAFDESIRYSLLRSSEDFHTTTSRGRD